MYAEPNKKLTGKSAGQALSRKVGM